MTTAIHDARKAHLEASAHTPFADRARAAVETSLDTFDSITRRGLARRVMRELVEGRISHAAAALRMRAVVARSKGGWMKRR